MSSDIQELTREAIAAALISRLLPLCPNCERCGTEKTTWDLIRVLEVVLDRPVTMAEVTNGRSAH